MQIAMGPRCFLRLAPIVRAGTDRSGLPIELRLLNTHRAPLPRVR